MRILVTGGAGFIGSHLCDQLVARGDHVSCVDNLHLGTKRNIAHLATSANFRFVEMDVLDRKAFKSLVAADKFDAFYHLAANSDISAGSSDRALDFRLNQLTTLAVLEAMVEHKIGDLFFASTSAVFGETEGDLDENSGPLKPISFYGASKLAAEAYISAYAHLYNLRAVVLRFPNVVGERATHGAIFDFLRKLKANKAELEILGDGRQTKPYLYVSDLVEAILLAMDKAKGPLTVLHAAGIGETSVREIAEIVVASAGTAETRLRYTGGDRGWPGDVPKFRYNIARLQALGWTPKRHSTDAVRHAVARILANGY